MEAGDKARRVHDPIEDRKPPPPCMLQNRGRPYSLLMFQRQSFVSSRVTACRISVDAVVGASRGTVSKQSWRPHNYPLSVPFCLIAEHEYSCPPIDAVGFVLSLSSSTITSTIMKINHLVALLGALVVAASTEQESWREGDDQD